MNSTTEVDERARRAVKKARQMLPQWRSYVRMLAKDPHAQVKLTSGGSYTDGKTIYLKVPPQLGDVYKHNRALCHRDSPVTGLPLCDGCAREAEVYVSMYHEVGHHVCDSFASVDPAEAARITTQVLAVEFGGTTPGTRAKKLIERIDEMIAQGTTFMDVAREVSPWLPLLLNAVEDVRVNREVMEARPGVRRMFMAKMVNIFENGIPSLDGSVVKWSERPVNNQCVIGMLMKPSGLDYSMLHPDVVAALNDPVITSLCVKANQTTSVYGTYGLAVESLERFRQLGFMLSERDPEDDEPEPEEEPEQEPEPEDQDDEQDDQDDDTDDESDDDQDDEQDEDDDDDGDPDPEDEGDQPDDGDEEPGDQSPCDDDESEGDAPHDDAPDEDGDDDADAEPDDDGQEGQEPDDTGDGDEEAPADDDGDEPADDSDDDGDADADADADEPGDDGEPEPGDGDADADPEPGDGEGAGGDEPGQHPGFGDPEDARRDLAIMGGHDPESEDLADVRPAGEADEDEDESEKAIRVAIVQEEYFDQPSQNIVGVNIHHYDPENRERGWAEDEWDAHVGDFEADETTLAPALRALRIVFAENRHARVETNMRRGRVNVRQLGRKIPTGDDSFFMRKTVPGRKDYEVIMGLDISGSTGGERIQMIRSAALAKADMLNRLGIPFSIYAHSGDYAGGMWSGDMSLSIHVIKEVSEKWNDTTKERLRNLVSYSANIDGHTLEFYRKVADRSSATDKIILYYTDGDMPCENFEEELEILQREIKTCRQRGYTLIGVGIGTDAPVEHGLDTVILDDVSDTYKVVAKLRKELGA